jgi:hypothetical protein
MLNGGFITRLFENLEFNRLKSQLIDISDRDRIYLPILVKPLVRGGCNSSLCLW